MNPETKPLEAFSAYDTAGKVIASLAPISNIHQHICGFHVNAQDRTRYVEAHHLCNHKRPDFYQCIIYDSEAKDARLIGIEYVVDENVFKSLPEDEKKYWHSHKYEVESGLVYLATKEYIPTIVDDTVERPAMHDLQKTYGKAVHTWAIDKDPDLPLGPPQLMMSVTEDGQLSDEVVQKRDNRLHISTEAKRKRRAEYLHQYAKDETADQWEKSGTVIAFEPKEVKIQAVAY